MSNHTKPTSPPDPKERFTDLLQGIAAARRAAGGKPGNGKCDCPVCETGTITYAGTNGIPPKAVPINQIVDGVDTLVATIGG